MQPRLRRNVLNSPTNRENIMLAFHGDTSIKAKYLKRVMAHQKADEIIHGKYWENGKGCAVGCTIHASTHGSFETELGIPIMLARLEDTLFEGQTNGKAKTFPARFLRAIRPSADLSRVGWTFLNWLLTEELAGREHPLVKKEIKACADVLIPLTKGESVDARAAAYSASAARAAYAADAAADAAYADAAYAADSAAYSAARAARAAYAAAYAADSAADSAADAAYSAAYSADSAAYAAYSAAYAADSAADSAADAAYSAAYSAAASAADAAYSAAYSAAARLDCYHRMADKLIKLLRAAPVPGGFLRSG
jgi:hypothetical protein